MVLPRIVPRHCSVRHHRLGVAITEIDIERLVDVFARRATKDLHQALVAVVLVLMAARRVSFYGTQRFHGNAGEILGKIASFHRLRTQANNGSSRMPVSSCCFSARMCGSMMRATSAITGTTTLLPNCL